MSLVLENLLEDGKQFMEEMPLVKLEVLAKQFGFILLLCQRTNGVKMETSEMFRQKLPCRGSILVARLPKMHVQL